MRVTSLAPGDDGGRAGVTRPYPGGMPSPAATAAASLRAAEELTALAPGLGWAEATGLADALVDALAHRLVDLAAGRAEPTPLPLVVGAIGGPDDPVDHASCRAAAARLRAGARLPAAHGEVAWAPEVAEVMTELAELLDHLADLSRRRTPTRADKGVVLRRLHRLHGRLR